MPLLATRGAASAQGFGEFAQTAVATYIEDVFSTYLYTGNGSTQTITNGIDLSGEGGLVWIKQRTDAAHALYDTARGVRAAISSNFTLAQLTASSGNELTAFNSNGFSLGTDSNYNVNLSSTAYASWTFRKAEKFFDVVTYTGNGTGGRTVAHNLGSVPGCIIVKRTDVAEDWSVYHRSLGNTKAVFLNYTSQSDTNLVYWNNTSPTSTVFSVGSWDGVNANGGTYVAYLFAHDAGGFGLTGLDNVISCGSFTHNGSSTAVNLGYQPQWFLLKRTDASGAWELYDNMRGFGVGSVLTYLYPNYSFAETTNGRGGVTATGVTWDSGLSAGDYIYIAIRRGPMKTPTTGTEVFSPNAVNAATGTKTSVGFPIDLQIFNYRPGDAANSPVLTRLTGVSTNSTSSGVRLTTSSTAAEASAVGFCLGWDNTGFQMPSGYANSSDIFWSFGRAPGFFDVVAYTGTGSARTVSHNLGVAPELMIVKIRNQSGAAWAVYNAISGNTKVIRLNTTAAETTSSAYWNNTTPTSSVFTVGNDGDVNNSADTYVAYLFASVTGVSKVGSYTGTGTTLQVNCGFTAGARFVLIKRTDSTGNWYVWDSARGIVAGNDPYLLLNSSAAEVTNTDYVDTYSAGFEISSTAPAEINANGGTFIFLAIA